MVLVSVVTATHNGERFVDETIRSVLAQRGVDLDYVIVDDASTDGTRRIVDQYTNPESPRYDSRVRKVYRDEHRGIISTYREGLRISGGKYVKFLDHDDVLPNPEALVKQARVLDDNPGIDIVVCPTRFVDVKGNPYKTNRYLAESGIVDKERLRRYLLFSYRGCPIVHGSMLSRRSSLEKFATFDQDFLVDVLVFGGDIFCLNENLFDYRIHKSNVSSTIIQRIETIKARTKMVGKLANNGLTPFQYPLMAYRAAMEAAKIVWLQVKPNR